MFACTARFGVIFGTYTPSELFLMLRRVIQVLCKWLCFTVARIERVRNAAPLNVMFTFVAVWWGVERGKTEGGGIAYYLETPCLYLHLAVY